MPNPNALHARLDAMVREKMPIGVEPFTSEEMMTRPTCRALHTIAIDFLNRLEEQEARVKELAKALELCMPHEVERLNVRDFDKPDFIYIGTDWQRNNIARAALSATPPPPETEVK